VHISKNDEGYYMKDINKHVAVQIQEKVIPIFEYLHPKAQWRTLVYDGTIADLE
jgi:hypothetical protein